MLTELQTQIKARLDAQTFFSATPAIDVIVEQRKDIANEIERRLARIGLAVIILTPGLSRRSAGRSPYPKWDRIDIACQVIENVTINRGASGIGQPSSLVAESVAYWLNDFAPAILGNNLMLEGITLDEDPTVLSYTVRLFSGGTTATAPVRI